MLYDLRRQVEVLCLGFCLLPEAHKLFLRQMLSGKLKLGDMVVRLHRRQLLIVRLHLTDEN
ncbi:hypothetical protein EYF80_008833 [Liparis tanakae]|uniref:Uncharacterized protein n=1 Tax=Liparis tanakae TaxID=230148 RepID=A0A4Z2ITA7_9TELE|nr:hypothetical protein EYF80_008833 [Liparis tanakae]